MKRKISLILVLAMILSVFSVQIAGAEELPYISYDDYITGTDGGWDSIRFDDVIQGTDGLAGNYVQEREGNVAGIADKVQVRGWNGFDQEIKRYGYIIDDKEVVLKEEFVLRDVPDAAAVKEAAAGHGYDYAARYYIEVDVSQWTETHNIKFCAELEDGTVITLWGNGAFPVEIYFTRLSADSTPTPQPTQAPLNEEDTLPGIAFIFDNEDIVDELAMGITSSNHLQYIEFDRDKKCATIMVAGGEDPNLYVPLTQMCMERDIEVSADTYKAILFGFRFDPAEAFNEPGATVPGAVYWQTEDNTGFNETKKQVFTVKLADEMQFSVANIEKQKKWTGTAADFRYDFIDTCDNDFTFNLYFIAFFKTVAGAEEFAKNYAEKGTAAFPATPTPAPTATPAPTEVPTATPEPTTPSETAGAATEAPKATEKAAESDKAAELKGGNTGLIIGIIAAVVVIAAVAIIVIKKKKK